MQECANMSENVAGGVPPPLCRRVSRDQRVGGEAARGFIPTQQCVYSSTTAGRHGCTLNQHQMQQNQACSDDSPGPASPAVNLPVALPGAPPGLQIYRY